MRTARPPPLQNPSRSAHGRLRIHRGLVQSSSPPFRPRLSFTDQLRMEPANRKPNRKPNTVHRNGVAPKTDRKDAELLALYAERERPQVRPPADAETQALQELVMRRE